MDSHGKSNIISTQADVVVVGRGGLAAAAIAAEAGAKNVILLEKAPKIGGNASVAGCKRVYHIGAPGLDDKGFGGAVPQKG